MGWGVRAATTCVLASISRSKQHHVKLSAYNEYFSSWRHEPVFTSTEKMSCWNKQQRSCYTRSVNFVCLLMFFPSRTVPLQQVWQLWLSAEIGQNLPPPLLLKASLKALWRLLNKRWIAPFSFQSALLRTVHCLLHQYCLRQAVTHEVVATLACQARLMCAAKPGGMCHHTTHKMCVCVQREKKIATSAGHSGLSPFKQSLMNVCVKHP